jgi:iron complex transport system ATP-binding protein
MPIEDPFILGAEDYTYRVGNKALIEKVNFRLKAGARCAIIGPNGAGKSTLLKSFCRILPAGEGRLSVNGRSWQAYSQRELAHWISYVPQAGGRDDLFSVRDFVLMGRYPHLSAFSNIRHLDWVAVEKALEMTGLAGLAYRRLGTLSGGEQQKAMIASALVQGSRVMLLDEPTAFLDPFQQKQIYELLEHLHRETNVTLVEVTHDVNRALLGHDTILALKQGHLLFSGSPDELLKQNQLQRVYDKDFILAPHPLAGKMMVFPEVPA